MTYSYSEVKISFFVFTSEFCLFYLTLIYKQEEQNTFYKYKNQMYFSKQCQSVNYLKVVDAMECSCDSKLYRN